MSPHSRKVCRRERQLSLTDRRFDRSTDSSRRDAFGEEERETPRVRLFRLFRLFRPRVHAVVVNRTGKSPTECRVRKHFFTRVQYSLWCARGHAERRRIDPRG